MYCQRNFQTSDMTTQNKELTPFQKIAVARKLVEADIINRAWEDDAFRVQLETDPKTALAEAGIPLPHSEAIRIVREEPGTIHIVLPPEPENATEIADHELAAVAGGGRVISGQCNYHEQNVKSPDAATRERGKFVMAIGCLIGLSTLWG